MAIASHTPTSVFRSGAIALVGRPNVGKSTLLNRLVGEKVSIVSGVPQTTRTRVVGIAHLPTAELIFLDTPGLHRPKHRLNETMVRAAHLALDEADLVFFLIDATTSWTPQDRSVLDAIGERRTPVFLIVNKVDLVPKPTLLPLLDACRKLFEFEELFPISAVHDQTFELLVHAAVARLPEGERCYSEEDYTTQTLRVMSAEAIREKILHRTREEVPHAVAVRIDAFDEDAATGVTTIQATILVEKESQKGIVIGAGGAMMKRVGEEARKELESVMDRRVFLKLWVAVEPAWRQNTKLLADLGYT